MSEPNTQPETPEPKVLGLLAQFPGPDELLDAAGKTTEAGVRKVDAYSPFPIHGIDDALRSKPSILPWIVFCCGLTGCIVALGMQYYMNGVEGPWKFSGYAYNISAKPFFSLPANIPVTFELIVLFSAFGSFFGMWILNGLPRLSNPLFNNERFQTATSHGFFLWVDAADEKFAGAQTLLQSLGAEAVDPIHEETEGTAVPTYLFTIGVVAACFALIPPLWIAAASGVSSNPRLSIWWDMDYQPKFKAQTPTKLFADGRAMREKQPGTVARGTLIEDSEYYRGIKQGGDLVAGRDRLAAQYVAMQEGAAPAEPPEPDWATEFPLPITEQLMARGQQRFNIYCSTCHGTAGDGNGLISLRAEALRQGTWVKPTSLHIKYVREQPYGKMFHTISKGIRKMPAYAKQISVEDRWAIVLYIEALQRSQHASLDDVPAEARNQLK